MRKVSTSDPSLVQEIHEALFKNAIEGVVVSDAGGNIKMLNSAALELFQYKEEELMERPITQLLPGYTKEKQMQFRSEFTSHTQAGKTGGGLRLAGKGKDGKIFPVEVWLHQFKIGETKMVSTHIRNASELEATRQLIKKKEQFNTQILDSLLSNICVIDQAGYITHTNERWKNFAFENDVLSLDKVSVGVNYLEIVEQSIIDHAYLAEEALGGIKRVLSGNQETFFLEYPCHSPKEKRWFDMRVTALGDGELHAIISHTDITVRKYAELARVESELTLSSVLQTVPDFIIQTDLNGSIIFINRIYPWHRKDQILGSDIHQWIVDEHKDAFRTMSDEVIIKGEDRYLELEVSLKKNMRRWFSVRIGAIYKNGQVKGLTYAATDMSDQMEAKKDTIRLAKIFNESLNEIYLFQPKSYRFIQVNKCATKNIGYDIEQLKKMTPLDLSPELNKDQFEKLLKPLYKGKQRQVVYEAQYKRRNGSLYPVEVHLQLLNQSDEPIFAAIVLDISRRKQIQQELIMQHHFVKKIMDASPNLIYIYDLIEKRNVYYNEYFSSLLGYTNDELHEFAGGVLDQVIHPDDIISKITFLRGILQSDSQLHEHECRLRHKEGHWIWMVCRSLIFSRDKSGNPTQIIASFTDISKRKRLELDLIKAVIQGQEQEKKRIAEDLHDGLGPLLSTVKMNLESLGPALSRSDEKTIGNLNTAKTILDQSMSEIRNISHNLVPALLQEFGLSQALKELCFKINQSTKVDVSFNFFGNDKISNTNVALGLYRIAEELLNNSIKHSKAKQIVVQLIRHSRSVVLTVEDNGIGIDLTKLEDKPRGIGLKNIKSRVAALNGSLDLDSSEGEGLIACIEIPMEAGSM